MYVLSVLPVKVNCLEDTLSCHRPGGVLRPMGGVAVSSS